MREALILVVSFTVAVIIYLMGSFAFWLGGFMVKNENKRWVKILTKVFNVLFVVSIIFLLWTFTSQVFMQIL